MEHVRVAVVGGGQAGLAVSHELTVLGVEHTRPRAGPGRPDLARPLGQLRSRDAELDRCSCRAAPTTARSGRVHAAGRDRRLSGEATPPARPVRERSDRRASNAGARVRINAAGRPAEGNVAPPSLWSRPAPYRRPHLPAAAGTLPRSCWRVDRPRLIALRGCRRRRAPGRQRPVRLPARGGTARGRSRGRRSRAASAPWSPRRVGGRDFVWWLVETGFFDARCRLAAGARRRSLSANVLATGRGGGHDLHLRVLRDAGSDPGRPLSSAPRTAPLALRLISDESVAWGDERYRQLVGSLPQARRRGGAPRAAAVRPLRRRRASTCAGLAPRSSRPASGRTMPPGCRGRRRSTFLASRCTTTGRAAPCRVSSSSAPTSCASGSRRS